MDNDRVICAKLKSGWVCAYSYNSPQTKAETQNWLNSLPVVVKTWDEPLLTFRSRRNLSVVAC